VARFLKHTACPVCGSSDALAYYEDGSTYCFSHGRSTKQATISPYVTAEEYGSGSKGIQSVSLPFDAVQDYSPQALAWTGKYEIDVPLLLKNKVYYSGARNQLIFSFLDGEGRVLAYQARNLNPVNKAKRYYTCGNISSLLPIFYCGLPMGAGSRSRLVLVEDCLSAIKVASLEDAGRDSMPCLGSGIPLLKLTRLRAFYDHLDVFLDPDMWHHSLKIVQQAQMLGFTARSIKADKDPKEISREELKELLK